MLHAVAAFFPNGLQPRLIPPGRNLEVEDPDNANVQWRTWMNYDIALEEAYPYGAPQPNHDEFIGHIYSSESGSSTLDDELMETWSSALVRLLQHSDREANVECFVRHSGNNDKSAD